LTADERAYIESVIDKIYDTFLGRVSEGRNMTKEQVHEVAQGRVWTGVMAKEIGLVDELGGLEKAIDIAAEEAGLENYKLREYPRAKDPVQSIVNKMQGNISLKTQLMSLTKNSGFDAYIQQLGILERYGKNHSVQAIMPFDIRVQNYSLR
jgi:protease-4